MPMPNGSRPGGRRDGAAACDRRAGTRGGAGGRRRRISPRARRRRRARTRQGGRQCPQGGSRAGFSVREERSTGRPAPPVLGVHGALWGARARHPQGRHRLDPARRDNAGLQVGRFLRVGLRIAQRLRRHAGVCGRVPGCLLGQPSGGAPFKPPCRRQGRRLEGRAHWPRSRTLCLGSSALATPQASHPLPARIPPPPSDSAAPRAGGTWQTQM